MSAGTEITDCDRADALMSGPHQSQSNRANSSQVVVKRRWALPV